MYRHIVLSPLPPPKTINLLTVPKGNRNKYIARKKTSKAATIMKTKRKRSTVTKPSTEVHPTSEPRHIVDPLHKEEPEDSQPLQKKR